MKPKKYLILLFSGLLFLIVYAGTNPKGNNILQTLTNNYYNFKTLDINQIYFPLSNKGNIDGTENWQMVTWDQLGEDETIVYDQGLWVIGKIDDHLKWAYGTWDRYSVYSPGPIIDGEAAMLINPQDSLRYRVYKISKGDDSSNPDYQEWPVDYGAPLDEQGAPRLYADQTLWTVYNGTDSTTYRQLWADTIDVMPVEVNQTVYARQGKESDTEDIFSNIIFLEYSVINKGVSQIDSTYIGFWTDIDFYNLNKNPPGVDTVKQLGYCWYSDDSFEGFPGPPPAVGYVLLYGPAVPSEGNMAIFKGKKRSNYKNLQLSSFHGFGSDYYLPWTLDHAWNLAKGLEMSRGDIIIDPTTGQPTTFLYSGDPVTNTGWIWEYSGTDSEAGFLMFSGPFTLAPADTQWIMLALVPGLGGDRFQSIEAMREKASILSQMPYDSLFAGKKVIGQWFAGEAQCKLEKFSMRAKTDSMKVQITFPNPYQHDFLASAIIKSVDNTYRDSLMLYDDGYHHDEDAGDGIWGTIIPPIAEEKEFIVSLIATDLNTNFYYTSNELARFITIGPVIVDYYKITSTDSIPNHGDRLTFKLTLKNDGLSIGTEDISTLLVSLDTCATIPAIAYPPSYGDIDAGQSVSGDHGQSVVFSNECPDSIWTDIKVEIYSDEKLWWSDTFSVFVHKSPTAITQAETDVPDKFVLKQNYPNPFNPSTMINYQLPMINEVELSIYNILGQKVTTLVSEKQSPGYYQVEWDASNYASGIYYYMITAGEFRAIRKMILLQ